MTEFDAEIRFETAPDGLKIRVGSWKAHGESCGTVILCPARTEFLEKYREVIGELGARGFDVWSLDWPGQGLSSRLLRNAHKGYIRSFETYLDNLEWFANDIVTPGAGETILLGVSMGGHVAARAVLEGRVKPDRTILAAPMIDLQLHPLKRVCAKSLSRGMTCCGLGSAYAPGMHDYDPREVQFEENVLMTDPARFKAIHTAIAANPDLALGGVTYGWLDAAFKSIRELKHLKKGAKPPGPALVCTAAADTVVSIDAQVELCAALPGWDQVTIEESKHEILQETDAVRGRFWHEFDRFTGHA